MPKRIEVDPARRPVAIATPVLNEVFSHAIEAVPEECCGLLVGDETQPFRRAVRCRNEMTRLHQRDPGSHPRDGRDAFHMNEQDYMRAEEEADVRGERVTAVYHSHVDCGAYFSDVDQEFAEQPLFPFPDADHLVVAVVGGVVTERALFRRDPDTRRFVGIAVVNAAS